MKEIKVNACLITSIAALRKRYLRRSPLMILCFLLSVFFTVVSFSDQDRRIITVEGMGLITGGDEADGRRQAIANAQRLALEQTLGVLISSDTIVRNFQTISDSIYARTEGYIQTYRILSEESDGSVYRVKLEAVVSLTRLRDELEEIGLLLEKKHMPRIMVVIPETHLGRPEIPDPAAETEVIRLFLEKGFEVVDQSQIKQIRYNDQVKAAAAGDNEAAQLIGMEYGAEVIIIGEAFSEFNMERAGLISCRARVEARAVETDTGRILAAHGFHGAGVDSTENLAGKAALANAGAKIAEYLMDQILKKWRKEVSSTFRVQIVVKVTNYEQLKEFKEFLQSISGMRNIHQRSFTANIAKLDTELVGLMAQDVANKISGASITSGKVSVVGFTANRIDAEIK